MSATHTPGPWVQWAGTNLIIRLHSGKDQAEDLRICEVAANTRNDEGRMNCALIAAAPDLLAACLRLQYELRALMIPDDPVCDVHAAIAKATARDATA